MCLLNVVLAGDLVIRMTELGCGCGNALGVGQDGPDGLSERVRGNPVVSECFSYLTPLFAEAVRVADCPDAGGED